MIRIAVDAMGGDNAPQAIVEGVIQAAKLKNDMEIFLVGDQSRINVSDLPQNVTIINATEVIENQEKPLMALRRKKDSSLVRALELLREQQVAAVVSAGNTGALMAGASLIAGRIPGVTKPALAPILPTLDGRGVVALDIGAAMDPKPENLLQFAQMGSLYASVLFGIDRPRVGLLNIGVEAEKGNELVKETHALLTKAQDLNFVGNVEARDVMKGLCEVLVCDGFTGNVLLKAMEGTAQAVFSGIKEAVMAGGVKAKVGALLMKPALKSFKARMDYSEHGGAPLLGLKGICIKCHGSANAVTVKNTIIKQAYGLAASNVLEKITNLTGGKDNE